MISDEQYLQFSPYFAQEDVEKKEDRLKFLRLLNTLPQAVKDLLALENTTEKILNISKDFELDEFDTEALSLVVRKLATGEVSIVQGTDLIIKELGLPQEKAGSLLNVIINEILAPIVSTPRAQPTPQETSSGQPMRPPQKTEEPVQTTDPRVIDLRNRQN